MDFFESLTTSFWLQILTAVVCGAAVGIERQSRNRIIGIRTSVLICLGTAIFVQLGSNFDQVNSDPARVLGQVVTGIGFLGAGVILARGEMITGVTTASVIWMLAAIGATIGLGHLGAAIVLTIITMAILIGIKSLDSAVKRLRQSRNDNSQVE